MRKMSVKRCEAGVCESRQGDTNITLFSWPNSPTVAAAWTRWVKNRINNFTHPSARSAICDLHFRPEDFVNRGQYDQGLAKCLRLRSDAVPSCIRLEGAKEPTMRQQRQIVLESTKEPVVGIPKTIYLPIRKPKQTAGRPEMISQGTQVQTNLTKPRSRSISIQCSLLPCPNIGTDFDANPAVFPAPVRVADTYTAGPAFF